MKKRIFSHILLFGLLLSCIPIPLQSSNWTDWVTQGRDWATQGLKRGASSFKAIGSNLYSYMPTNMSQYLPSSLQWLTKLSEDQKWKLFLALGGMLGIGGLYKLYKIYADRQLKPEDQETIADRQLKSEDQETINEAKKRGFTDNRNDFSVRKNATNIVSCFFWIENYNISELKENKALDPNRLFRVFIYPVLKNIVQNEIDIANLSNHEEFWSKKIEEIKENNTDRLFELEKENNHYLKIIRDQLKKGSFDEPQIVGKILNSLNQALKEDQGIQKETSTVRPEKISSEAELRQQALDASILKDVIANNLGFNPANSLIVNYPYNKNNLHNVAKFLEQEDQKWSKLDEVIANNNLALSKKTVICNIFKLRVVPILKMFPHDQFKYDTQPVVETALKDYQQEMNLTNSGEHYGKIMIEYVKQCEQQ